MREGAAEVGADTSCGIVSVSCIVQHGCYSPSGQQAHSKHPAWLAPGERVPPPAAATAGGFADSAQWGLPLQRPPALAWEPPGIAGRLHGPCRGPQAPHRGGELCEAHERAHVRVGDVPNLPLTLFSGCDCSERSKRRASGCAMAFWPPRCLATVFGAVKRRALAGKATGAAGGEQGNQAFALRWQHSVSLPLSLCSLLSAADHPCSTRSTRRSRHWHPRRPNTSTCCEPCALLPPQPAHRPSGRGPPGPGERRPAPSCLVGPAAAPRTAAVTFTRPAPAAPPPPSPLQREA